MTAFGERITEAPCVYDASRGAEILESLTKAFRGASEFTPAAALLADSRQARDLLQTSFSASPYLASLALRNPADLAECLVRNPEDHLAEARAALAAAIAQAESSQKVSALLRHFKRRMALLTGLADLGGVWPTEETLRALSGTADAALEQATAFLVRKARRHSGDGIELTEREKRAPLLFLWPRVWRYLRHKDR